MKINGVIHGWHLDEMKANKELKTKIEWIMRVIINQKEIIKNLRKLAPIKIIHKQLKELLLKKCDEYCDTWAELNGNKQETKEFRRIYEWCLDSSFNKIGE